MASATKSVIVTDDTPLVHMNAPTHLPTKLTQSNFLVWRTQLNSTLIGLGLLSYIDGSIVIPEVSLKDNVPNPAYSLWNRQDKIILSAMLGSCHETIQPLVSTASTAREMWNKLMSLYANSSRSRIISLKNHLHNNPCNSRPIAEYLHDFRATADELALVGHPVSDDDLVLHILTGLGDDYKSIRDALKVRESCLSFGELHDMLTDCERGLKSKAPEPSVITANYTHRANANQRGLTTSHRSNSRQNFNSYSFNRNHDNRGSFNHHRSSGFQQPRSTQNKDFDLIC